MAALYLKTGATVWSAAGSWSTTSAGGADNSGPPIASTDCIAELLSGSVTIDAGAVCRSLDCTSGTGSYTGTMTHGTGITLSIGDATAGAGNVALKFSAGMTYAVTGTAQISFISSSVTQQTVTSAGIIVGTIVFNNASGSWQLADNMTTSSNTWTFVAGSWDLNGKTITMTNGSPNFNGGGKTYSGSVVFTPATNGSIGIAGANTYTTLTITGAGSNGTSISILADQTITGTLTLNGANTGTGRMSFVSGTIGTARNITTNSPTVSNCDFMDITAVGTGWNLSAITGLSGDAGGNTGITFTTPATQFWQTLTTGSKNWSTAGNWFLATNGGGGAGRIPLPQDNATFDANSIGAASTSITADMGFLGTTIDWTGVTNSPTWLISNKSNSIFGSLTLVTGMTLTTGAVTTTFRGRGSFTLTNAGKSFIANSVQAISMPGGTLTLQDAFLSNAGLTINNGTFNANGFNVTALTFSSTNANTRSIIIGSGIWAITGNNAIVWTTETATNLTLTRGSPIQFTYSGSVGTRTITNGGAGGIEARAPDISIVAGTDTLSLTGGGGDRQYHNVDFTGFSGTLNNLVLQIYGNITYSAGMTINSGINATSFNGTVGTQTITSNGKTLDFPINFGSVGGSSYQLADAFTVGATRLVTITNGTLSSVNGSNNYVISVGNMQIGATGGITLGSATHLLTGTGNIWNVNAAATINAGTSTLKITDTSNTAISFLGTAHTYGNVWWSRGVSTASNTISGSNTFSDFKDDGTAAHSILFTAGITTTVGSFHVTGNGAGNEISINSTTTAVHNLVKTGGGVVSSDYLNIQHSVARPWSGAAGTDTWYAGTHSINNQAVATAGSGWIFTQAPSTGGGLTLQLGDFNISNIRNPI